MWGKLQVVWRSLFPIRPLGERGEIAAAKFLKSLGYKIVHRNYEIGGGEIDIVAVEDRTVVFVEVKTRSTSELGSPTDSVDDDKQKQLSRIALLYIKRYHLQQYRARFDIVAVVWPKKNRRPQLKHYRNAFLSRL